MDVKTYATVVDLCGRFAGRLSDNILGAVRGHYFGGEEAIAESALLLGLALENVGITREEHELLRSVVHDPDNPDLDAVPIVDEVPPVAYRFSPTGPPNAPDPARADAVLSADVQQRGVRRLRRVWQTPVNDQFGGTWVYVVQVDPDVDPLGVYSGLSSVLALQADATWPVEVVTEGSLLFPYQAAALTAARQVWP
jgi:hypothetical protein